MKQNVWKLCKKVCFDGMLFLELLESSFLISQPASYLERKLQVYFFKPGVKS
jgi:hypothetical protein